MSEEEWKFIDEAPGYLVSSGGLVKVEKTGKILIPNVSQKGYQRLTLWPRGSKPINRKVHRLVAAAFCGGCLPGYTVNHINGDKSDNRAENLEWVSLLENMQHGYDEGLLPTGDRHYNAKLTDEQADEILVSRWESTAATLSERFGVGRWTVSAIWTGRARSRNLGKRMGLLGLDNLPVGPRAFLASFWLFLCRIEGRETKERVVSFLDDLCRMMERRIAELEMEQRVERH